MSLFGKLFSATIKTAILPVAVVKDTIGVLTDDVNGDTLKTLESAIDDLSGAAEDLTDGDII